MISLQFLITTLVVVLAPGTGVIYTLAIGLGQGPRNAIWAAAGCTLGIVPHLLAAIFGLAAILHSSAVLFSLIKWVGVAYLLYLAYQAVKEGGTLSLRAERNTSSGWAIGRRAALINILNPKLSLFFLALLPPFLSGAAETATLEMLTLGGVFMAATFVIFVLYGLFAAQTRRLIMANDRVLRWLNRSIASVFALLAGRLALEQNT
ncbi:LysE family translocator [Epibacterium sp. SM1969]|uniref:LysE family translocator n=1 Tax=Tritonibacter aquimaris TaxID=2663379 RepID=A0A844AL45_9RHOB|nr:LysE family translocator [Tritonibacter aquimaris]MQY42169.1 LysE family translocator [Tritonibacter aquimaris]